MPKIYVVSTTILVGEAISATNPTSGDFSTAQQLADTYAQISQREPILDATVKALGLPMTWDQLRPQVLAVHQLGSPSFEVRVFDVDPYRAKLIAQGITDQLIATSPTEQTRKALAERRQFIRTQLDVLQQKIDRASAELEDKQNRLADETSARGVLERQDEIRALELNLSSWRPSYASLLNSDQSTGGGPNTLTVIEPPTLPRQPSGSDATWQLAASGFAGLLLAGIVILALEFLDSTVKSKEELQQLLGAPTLAQISQFNTLQKQVGSVISVAAPAAAEAEAYRMLSTSLRFTKLNGSGAGATILITSPAIGDGKSVTAANVAAVLAQQGHEVLLVDLDLRNPSLHRLFDVSNDRGLTSVLLNRGWHMADCVVPTALPLLKLLPTGPLPPNPGSFIGRLGELLLQEFRDMAEFVIIDSPPLLAVTDAVALASLADATLLVARAGKTRRDSCRSARELLERANATVVGTVFNGVSRGNLAHYGYGYVQGAQPPRRSWTALLQRFVPTAERSSGR
jgi:non-specific protein-tyrosine kinase